jgi:hypothetical protein
MTSQLDPWPPPDGINSLPRQTAAGAKIAAALAILAAVPHIVIEAPMGNRCMCTLCKIRRALTEESA